ncbi:MAG: AMP-binding protein [Nitrospinota bacterium]|nr:AMP-binding protein [Nitrospinota bacterium]
MEPILNRILGNCLRLEDKPAYIYYQNDQAHSLIYRDFLKLILSLKNAIDKENVPAGGRAILVGENSPHWSAAYLAAHMSGLTVVHGDANFTESEFANIEDFTEPSLILCDKKFSGVFKKTDKKIFIDEIAPLSNYVEPTIHPFPADQPMSIIFTSGTTAEPKGVMLSQLNYLSNLEMIADKYYSAEDRFVSFLPFHHVYPFMGTVILPLYLGGTTILVKSLKGEDIFGAIKKHGGTTLITVPRLLELMWDNITEKIKAQPQIKQNIFKNLLKISRFLDRCSLPCGKIIFGSIHKNFPNFRCFACGGAPLGKELHRNLHAIGFTILEAYGLTETSPIAAINSLRTPLPGSVGRAAPGVEIKLTKKDLADPEGEICIKGPNVMMGYYKRPDLTAEAVRNDWFYTGDIGRISESGAIYITGRKKEVIILSNGKNIYPQELEQLYANPEKIKDLCIIMLKEGEREYLAVLINPCEDYFAGKHRDEIFEEIKSSIEESAKVLPSFQKVTRVELIFEDLPRTPMGKLRRFKVAEILERRVKPKTVPSESVSGNDFLDEINKLLRISENLSMDSHLDTDLGLDSLAKFSLFSGLEQNHGIKFSEEEMISVQTLKDLEDILNRKTKG